MQPYFGRTFILSLASMLLLGAFSSSVQAQVRSELQLFSDSFVSSSFAATTKSDYQFASASLKTDPLSKDPLRLDVAGAVAFGAPLLNYLNPAEVYVNYHPTSDQQMTLGRAKFLWSELDARWDLGVWEPVFKWNPLSPERQGLTGLFWQTQNSGIEMTLFASALFLPDQGPSFDIKEGEFVRGNPWFRRPPESVRIFDETTAIEYNFERPNESDIVFRASYGGRLLLANKDHVRWSLSYLYKPMNQLALGYDQVLDIAKDRGVVVIKPEVFYHTLFGTDLVFNAGRFRFGGSGTFDRPNKEVVFDESWTAPVFSNATLLSGFVEYNSGPIILSAQRMEVYGGEITEFGKNASADRRPLMSRYSFRQANEVSALYAHRLKRLKGLEVKASLLGSDRQDFSLIRLHGKVIMSSLWQFFGEMQLIQATDEAFSANSKNQNEISQYANNDRFMLGVSYVF